jgi:tetratricopeptide (TPR) repeat protein
MTYQGRTIGIAAVQELLGLTDDETERGDANRVFKRGALLHADIAMLAPVHSHTGAGLSSADLQDMVFLYRDGRLQGVESAGVHWRLGRMLLDEVRPDPSRDEMVRMWYRATGASLQTSHSFVDATPHLARGRQLFPGDADLLLYSGSMHESMATPLVQVAALPTQPGFSSSIRSPRAELQQAETFFRQAVKSSPTQTEARVRLGRVLDLLGRHEDGAAELRRAASATEDPLLLYYADLFLGQAELALSHRGEARASFERAASRYPRAQSPRLALSQLARRYGDRAGALAAIQHVLDLPASEDRREDPWWYYNEVHMPGADRLLDEMRKPFLAAEPR